MDYNYAKRYEKYLLGLEIWSKIFKGVKIKRKNMKKISKKILGILGLTLVVAMTIFAALLPETEASASEQEQVIYEN